MSAGIRPMIFDTNADGSTRNIYVQLSNYHGVAVVDCETRKEIARIEHPAIPGPSAHTDGLQARAGARARRLAGRQDALVDQQGVRLRLRLLAAGPQADRARVRRPAPGVDHLHAGRQVRLRRRRPATTRSTWST